LERFHYWPSWPVGTVSNSRRFLEEGRYAKTKPNGRSRRLVLTPYTLEDLAGVRHYASDTISAYSGNPEPHHPCAIRRVGRGMRRDKPTPSVRLDEHFGPDLTKARLRGLLIVLFLVLCTTTLAIPPGKFRFGQEPGDKSPYTSPDKLTWSRLVSGI
jgi:hypothetical protein